jgi:hypothetical protein
MPFSSEHQSDRSFIRPVTLGAGSPSSLGTNSGRHSRSLLVKVIVGGTALFVVAGAYLSYQTVRSMMLENLKQNALLEVKHSTDEIDKWLASLKARVEMLANTELVRSVDWSLSSHYLKAEDRLIR